MDQCNDAPVNLPGRTHIMDPVRAPSANAAAARLKSEEVMAALRGGEQGAADRLMGKPPAKGAREGGGWLRRMFGGGKKGEGEGEVVR